MIADIVDSGYTVRGYTVQRLRAHLATCAPVSVRLCTLLDKPHRRQVPVTIDYCGVTISDVFVVGSGLDDNEHYRHLPDLCVLEPS